MMKDGVTYVGNGTYTLKEAQQKMRKVSPIWDKIVEEWGTLERLYLEESPSGQCPKLYEKMNSLGC